MGNFQDDEAILDGRLREEALHRALFDVTIDGSIRGKVREKRICPFLL
jgi:hypothetical protein